MNKTTTLFIGCLALGLSHTASAEDCDQKDLFFEVNLLCYQTTLEDAFDEIGKYAEYDDPNEVIQTNVLMASPSS